MKTQILNIENTLKLSLQGIKLIEASAGTGKTYAIGNLYLRFICAGECVSNILVVTFTIAATEELRGRIRLRLHQALQQLQGHEYDDAFLQQWVNGVADATLIIARLQAALRSMDQAAIYTIHGFCQRALAEHALASGQPFDTEMIADDRYLWQQAIHDWWRRHGYPLNPCHMGLFSYGLIDLDHLIDWQERLRGTSVQVIPAAKWDMDACYQAWQALQSPWRDLCLTWQAQRVELMDMLYNNNVLGRGEKTYRHDNITRWEPLWASFFGGDTWWQWPDCLKMLTANQLDTHSKSSKRGQDPALNNPFFLAIDDWLNRADAISMQFRMAALEHCHDSVNTQVLRIKQQQGLMSFHDQLQWLAEGLTRNLALADALRKRFPVAMIDEFQDTDALQYTIFHTIYQNANALMMIGDPKQAIYGFRGGDIFTYIAAAADAQERWTLDHNWRSTPTLVDGVNAIFQHRKSPPFLFEGINFTCVKAANEKAPLLVRCGTPSSAIVLWRLPPTAHKKNQPATRAEPIIVGRIANEIATLLQQARQATALLGNKPVTAGDIAVLVRTHGEAEKVYQALQAVQVAAVVSAQSHVFASEEAEGLRLLLAAIAAPQDQALLHQALASSLLGYDYAAMATLSFDSHQWLHWCERIQHLHLQWQQRGFMPMFQQLLHRLGVASALAMQPLPERRLTNVLHLGELLQQAAQTRPNMGALIHWFGEQGNARGEDAELRLESDAARVRIVTIHASKGLEYPIVFIPFAWKCRRIKDKDPVVSFYDVNHKQRVIDMGSRDQDKHRILAEQERLAEDVRLLYVALTRASSHMVIVWGHVGRDQSHTALHSLLHGQDSTSISVMDADLERLCQTSTQAIACVDVNMDQENLVQAPVQEDQPTAICTARKMVRVASRNWRIVSFSVLTRGLAHPPFQRVTGDDPIFTLRAGKQTGVFLHGLLEMIDFQGDILSEVVRFCERHAIRYGLPPDCATVIAPWMQEVVHTRLQDDGLTLSTIHPAKRLNELSFDYPINTLKTHRLDALLDQYAGRTLPPLNPAQYQGFMNGVIDLVFEHDGRYYIADYKGNALGSTLEDYCPSALRVAVHQRRYDLQYLIYSVALHRYLTLRVINYTYETHFGGVYYLFLRGMREEHGSRYGVHVDRLPLGLLQSYMVL